MNRRERDVHILPQSPLVDAGRTGWNRTDLDGSIPDIGCYPFLQDVEHPPFISGSINCDTDIHTDFGYTATVYDDGDDVNVRFFNLPEWLEEADRNDYIEEVHLAGNPPQDAEDFYDFTIHAVDDNDQIDSLEVRININRNRILTGEVSGRLTSGNSPYIIIGELTVSEDKHLIIEPGTELRFRFSNDLFLTGKLLVSGSLEAVGSEHDTILFAAESVQNSVLKYAFWNGIHFRNANSDSSVLEFCRVQDAYRGITIERSDNIRISHCWFEDNQYGLYSLDSSVANITENCFYQNSFINLLTFPTSCPTPGNGSIWAYK